MFEQMHTMSTSCRNLIKFQRNNAHTLGLYTHIPMYIWHYLNLLCYSFTRGMRKLKRNKLGDIASKPPIQMNYGKIHITYSQKFAQICTNVSNTNTNDRLLAAALTILNFIPQICINYSICFLFFFSYSFSLGTFSQRIYHVAHAHVTQYVLNFHFMYFMRVCRASLH